MASRWKIILLLLIPIIILSGYLVKVVIDQNVDKQKALQIFEKCVGEERVGCLSMKTISYISEHPANTGNIFETFWKLEKDGILSEDARVFSDIAHYAGMALINNHIPLGKAVVFCGTAFKQGCIHGAVMEHIDQNYPAEVQADTLFNLCRKIAPYNHFIYINCLHGVGHELFAKNKISIQTVLHLCDSLSYIEHYACVSGALMEFSKGTEGGGSHSHALVGKKELPCLELDDKYKAVCYASAGSYRQYNTDQENFSTSYNFCFASPEQYVEDCLGGLSERAILATADNQEKLNTICKNINSKDKEARCINSIQKIIKSNQF